MTTIKLDGYTASILGTAEPIFFGVKNNYGIETIQLIRGELWEDKEIILTFNMPNGESHEIHAPSDEVAVDSAITQVPGFGSIVIRGVNENERVVANPLKYRVRDHAGIGDSEFESNSNITDSILLKTKELNGLIESLDTINADSVLFVDGDSLTVKVGNMVDTVKASSASISELKEDVETLEANLSESTNDIRANIASQVSSIRNELSSATTAVNELTKRKNLLEINKDEIIGSSNVISDYSDNLSIFTDEYKVTSSISSDLDFGLVQTINVPVARYKKYHGFTMIDLPYDKTTIIFSAKFTGRWHLNFVEHSKRPGSSSAVNIDGNGLAISIGKKSNNETISVSNSYNVIENIDTFGGWMNISVTIDKVNHEAYYEIKSVVSGQSISGMVTYSKDTTVDSIEAYTWAATEFRISPITVLKYFENEFYYTVDNGDCDLYYYDRGFSPVCASIEKRLNCIERSLFFIQDKNCVDYSEVYLPDGLLYIAPDAFYLHDKLQTIHIPKSLTEIKHGAFDSCTVLNNVLYDGTIEKWNEVSKDMDWGNSIPAESLECLDGTIPILKLVETFECGDNPPDIIAKLYSDGNLIISGTDEMASDVSLGNYANLIKTVEIQDGVTAINNLFPMCDNLESVTVPNSVVIIYPYAFNGCSKLSNIEMSEGLTYIGDYAFSGCTSLTSIEIPSGVISIGNHAFSYTGLTSITIPNSVTSIGVGAFYDCTNLTDIYFTGTEEQWNAISKSGADIPSTATIHYNSTGPSQS